MEQQLFNQLKELLIEKFNHLEQTIKGIEDRNAEDHRALRGSINELFVENKKLTADQTTIENKLQESIEKKSEAQGQRMGKIETELARQDEKFKNSSKNQSLALVVVGLIFTAVSVLISIFK
jgi:regulator of replication initiation timing